MIALLRRALTAAVTPRPQPADLVSVPAHTRRKPVNAKRESLHERMRAELGR